MVFPEIRTLTFNDGVAMENNAFSKLRKELLDLANLSQLSSLLEWDQNVNVPSGGHRARADVMAYVAHLRHEKFVAKKFENLLRTAVESAENGKLENDESFIALKTLSDFKKAKKLPTEFVGESARLYGESYQVWVEARAKSDFLLFEPYLTRIVQAKKQEAEYLGYIKSPYDALMDNFEPGLTTEFASKIFDQLKAFMVPFVERIGSSRVKIDRGFLYEKYPIKKQSQFVRVVAEKIGFDFHKGRLDVSTHPFCQSLHSTDVRLTTRFDEKDFINQALLSVIHEVGHGLYDQGLPEEYFGTPLGESISLGIHESQSRLWENQVGRSWSFWVYFYEDLKKSFPSQLEGVSLSKFYRAINFVKPGLIRVDADEATYNLHVILRFEIERDLIEGNIEVAELPDVWSRKIKEYLDLIVPNDARGVLQDIHWSKGLFGYFPTYIVGNLYAAQFFDTARKQIRRIDSKISNGQFSELKEWLKNNIHVHGRRYSSEELLFKATGNKSTPVYFMDYIKAKYSEIYNL